MNNKLVASALMSLILSAGILVAQNGPVRDKTSPEAARLTRVSVHQGKKGVSVEITCSRPVTPTPTMISDPSRLVLDFADTVSGESRNRISVNRDGLKSVRIGVQPADPPVTRVVLDLEQERAYQLIADGNRLTVKLGQEGQTSTSAASDPEDKQGSVEPSSVPEGAAGEPSSPLPSGVAGTTSPVAADSATAPNLKASPSAPAADPVEPKPTASPAEQNRQVIPPTQIASIDPTMASAAVVAPAGRTESVTKQTADSKPLALVSDRVVQTQPAASNSGPAARQGASPLGDAPTPAPVPTEADVKSSPATVAAPVSTASIQPLSLSAAKVTPELPPVTPPVTPLSKALAAQPTPAEYVIGEQDVLSVVVWKERELSATVVVRPDGNITLPLINEIKVVGLTPTQLQALLTEKFKPFLNIPQVTVEVVQINSRKAYLIGEVGRTGTFPLNSSTTVLQIIAQAGGLRDFAKRKDIYILRNQNGKQVRYRFNYDEVIRGKNTQQNIVLQPGDMVVVP